MHNIASLTEQELNLIGVRNSKYRDTEYKRLSWDEYFMNLAFLVAMRSHDAQTQHGTVLTKDNRIISTGFNGFPPGSKDTEIPNVRLDGMKYPMLHHSEVTAIFNAAIQGVSVKGCRAYITGMPCDNCAKALVHVGIYDWVIGPRGHQESENENIRRRYWIESFNVSVTQFIGELMIK